MDASFTWLLKKKLKLLLICIDRILFRQTKGVESSLENENYNTSNSNNEHRLLRRNPFINNNSIQQ